MSEPKTNLKQVSRLCLSIGGEILGQFKLPTPKLGHTGVIAFEWKFRGVSYWVMITREFFNTFWRKYPKEPKGPGISIELVLLEHAVKADPNSVVLNVMKDMKFYAFGARKWLEYARVHGTISDFPNQQAYQLASIPVSFLRRWYPEEGYVDTKLPSGQVTLL